MGNYLERKIEWERTIEDILVEMVGEKSGAGLAIRVNVNSIAEAFLAAIKQIDRAKESKKSDVCVLIPGDVHNEE